MRAGWRVSSSHELIRSRWPPEAAPPLLRLEATLHLPHVDCGRHPAPPPEVNFTMYFFSYSQAWYFTGLIGLHFNLNRISAVLNSPKLGLPSSAWCPTWLPWPWLKEALPIKGWSYLLKRSGLPILYLAPMVLTQCLSLIPLFFYPFEVLCSLVDESGSCLGVKSTAGKWSPARLPVSSGGAWGARGKLGKSVEISTTGPHTCPTQADLIRLLEPMS